MPIHELYQLFLQHPDICTDTRECKENSIFFALRGTTFNGNDYALKALEKGCAYAVVDEAGAGNDERLIHTDNALATLQELATYHRKQLRTPILQITGTNGKTTTKELTAAVLSERMRVLYTQGNLNNHIGVPKTLLRLRPEHEIAVIETGANHPGEIAQLSNFTDPDCGLITNVGKAHLEGFGSFEGVKRTKGELYDYLRHKPGTFIFLNADSHDLPALAHGLDAVTYGKPGMGYDVEGEVTACDPFVKIRFRAKGGEWQIAQTHLIGAYNADNILAAAAVGHHFGIPMEQAAHAIACYEPTNNRSEFLRTGRNELIVDAYNANPTSMKAALDNFALIDHPHKMAILGEMRELGTASATEHKKIAELAKSIGCETLWLVGGEFEPFAEGARHFPDVEAVKAALQGGASPTERLILVKGSNGTRLYELPSLL